MWALKMLICEVDQTQLLPYPRNRGGVGEGENDYHSIAQAGHFLNCALNCAGSSLSELRTQLHR